MRHRSICGLFLLLLTCSVLGCSAETQREAKEALKESGEAIESAADDAGKVIDGAVDGAKDAVADKDAVDTTE